MRGDGENIKNLDHLNTNTLPKQDVIGLVDDKQKNTENSKEFKIGSERNMHQPIGQVSTSKNFKK